MLRLSTLLTSFLCLISCVNDDGIYRNNGIFASAHEPYSDFDVEGAKKVEVGMDMGEAMYLIKGNALYINRTVLGYCQTYQQMKWMTKQSINVCFDEEAKKVTYVSKQNLE